MGIRQRLEALEKGAPVTIDDWAAQRADAQGVIVLTQEEADTILRSVRRGCLAIREIEGARYEFDYSLLRADQIEKLDKASGVTCEA